MEQDQGAVERVNKDDARSLVTSLTEDPGVADHVRLVFRYAGDRHDVVHVREDVDDAYTDAELRQRIETLTLKGLADPPKEGALHDLGALEATVRWFDDAVCVYAPDEEWAGVVAVLDRTEPAVRAALDHLDD